MICQKCNNQGILNTVLGRDFYYCRTCKEEINLSENNKNLCLESHNWSYCTDKCLDCGITGIDLLAKNWGIALEEPSKS